MTTVNNQQDQNNANPNQPQQQGGNQGQQGGQQQNPQRQQQQSGYQGQQAGQQQNFGQNPNEQNNPQ